MTAQPLEDAAPPGPGSLPPNGLFYTARTERTGWGVVIALAIGYVGIYLCRKNLSVAVPMLQTSFGATKAQVGQIASMGTLAYAAGKFVNGPLVDRVGARAGFLLSLAGVAVLGAAGAFAPGLGALTLIYALNRFAGSAAWGAMLKIVPSWFGRARTGTAVAILSLSYVGGGALATLLARQIVEMGGSWRVVMGAPAGALVVIGLACAWFVRSGPLTTSGEGEPAAAVGGAAAPAATESPAIGATSSAIAATSPAIAATSADIAATGPAASGDAAGSGAPALPSRGQAIVELLRSRQFLVVCALSFTLTLMRESFNTWSVDFLVSVQGGSKSVATAALQSIGFDLAGAVSILGAGWAYDRISPARRSWAMAGLLALLAVVLWLLPGVALAAPLAGAALVGLVGLLVYGPYSLLAGAMAVETGGARLAATSAGIIDGVGYVAGALAGAVLGSVLDAGGYALGFRLLAGVTLVAALLALRLHGPQSKA